MAALYQVKSAEDFKNLKDASSGTWYKLMNDIDLSEETYYDGGSVSNCLNNTDIHSTEIPSPAPFPAC